MPRRFEKKSRNWERKSLNTKYKRRQRKAGRRDLTPVLHRDQEGSDQGRSAEQTRRSRERWSVMNSSVKPLLSRNGQKRHPDLHHSQIRCSLNSFPSLFPIVHLHHPSCHVSRSPLSHFHHPLHATLFPFLFFFGTSEIASPIQSKLSHRSARFNYTTPVSPKTNESSSQPIKNFIKPGQ